MRRKHPSDHQIREEQTDSEAGRRRYNRQQEQREQERREQERGDEVAAKTEEAKK